MMILQMKKKMKMMLMMKKLDRIRTAVRIAWQYFYSEKMRTFTWREREPQGSRCDPVWNKKKSPSERRFKNTFAPYVENKELPLEAIIRLLFLGLPLAQLPVEIQTAVREEMGRRKRVNRLNSV